MRCAAAAAADAGERRTRLDCGADKAAEVAVLKIRSEGLQERRENVAAVAVAALHALGAKSAPLAAAPSETTRTA